MRNRACDRFLMRLDRGEDGLATDPHVTSCASCAMEMRSARRLREMLASRSLDPEIAAAPAPSFARRVALIASAERRERKTAAEGMGRRLIASPAFVVTVSLTAVALSVQMALPWIAGAGRLRLDPALPPDFVSSAVAVLACVGVAAIVSARLMRRAVG